MRSRVPMPVPERPDAPPRSPPELRAAGSSGLRGAGLRAAGPPGEAAQQEAARPQEPREALSERARQSRPPAERESELAVPG